MTELVETNVVTLEVVEVGAEVVIPIAPAAELVETNTEVSEVVEVGAELAMIDAPAIEYTEVGVQGPPGARGPIGPPSGSAITIVAGADLGGNRVVTGAAAYADSSDIATAGRAIGVTIIAAVEGDNIDIICAGELGGFSGLVVNGLIYTGNNGTLTQVLPTEGYIQTLGVVVSPTKILVNISPPIIII